jgi:hypothetical protein
MAVKLVATALLLGLAPVAACEAGWAADTSVASAAEKKASQACFALAVTVGLAVTEKGKKGMDCLAIAGAQLIKDCSASKSTCKTTNAVILEQFGVRCDLRCPGQ